MSDRSHYYKREAVKLPAPSGPHRCRCGRELSVMATSCPGCGRTFVGKTCAIVVGFVVFLIGVAAFFSQWAE